MPFSLPCGLWKGLTGQTVYILHEIETAQSFWMLKSWLNSFTVTCLFCKLACSTHILFIAKLCHVSATSLHITSWHLPGSKFFTPFCHILLIHYTVSIDFFQLVMNFCSWHLLSIQKSCLGTNLFRPLLQSTNHLWLTGAAHCCHKDGFASWWLWKICNPYPHLSLTSLLWTLHA